MGEAVLKGKLMEWVTEWLQQAELAPLVRKSWEMILRKALIVGGKTLQMCVFLPLTFAT